MDLILKTFGLVLIALFSSCQVQQTEKISIKNSKIIEANKKEFIGKPLSYVLSVMDKSTIKSVKAFPNKNKNEVARITFRQLSHTDYLKIWTKRIEDNPTQITIVINQNFSAEGKLCRPKENPQCAEWTKEDEQNLGHLIVDDIYVLGKD